ASPRRGILPPRLRNRPTGTWPSRGGRRPPPAAGCRRRRAAAGSPGRAAARGVRRTGAPATLRGPASILTHYAPRPQDRVSGTREGAEFASLGTLTGAARPESSVLDPEPVRRGRLVLRVQIVRVDRQMLQLARAELRL